MLGTYIHKFTLPKGPQVFIPSASSRHAGAVVHREVRRRWRVPHYFYHLRAGGHVAALRTHLHNHVFATLDISRFFDSVTRTKVHRALRSIGIGHERAWEIAQESTVEKNRPRRDFSVPYGFVQSPVLASVALDRSALGREMKTVARSNHTRLSCYVDDVILSGIEQEAVESSRLALIEAAHQSGFVLNDAKSQRPGAEVTVFNVVLSNGMLAITADRMHEFEDDILALGPLSVTAIIAYVRSINRFQADELVPVALRSSDEAVREVVAKAPSSAMGP
jgi:Reverse transcriptase (RNA-dependent DNA polymerase)